MQFDIFRPKRPHLLGLDISANAVRIVEIGLHGDGYRLEKFAIKPLPAGAVVEGNIVNPEEIAAVIKKAVVASGSSLKHVAVALPASQLTTKIVTMSGLLTEDEVEQNLPDEAKDHIPFSINEVALDFAQLSLKDGLLESGEQQVLLAAARSDKIDERIACVDIAGLKCVVVDSELASAAAALELVSPRIDHLDKNIVYAVVEDEYIDVRVLRNGAVVFSRQQSLVGISFSADIVNGLGLTAEEALAVERDRVRQEELGIDSVILPYAEMVARELARAIQMYESSHDRVDVLVVSGDIASSRAFIDVLGKTVDLPVKVANPFAAMQCADTLNKEHVRILAPQLMVAVGLALRRFDRGAKTNETWVGQTSIHRLNFLPYREEHRAGLRRQFAYLAGTVASMALAVALLVHGIVAGYIAAQDSRNSTIASENAKLDAQIAEIKRINTDIDALLARKAVIESLQSDRAQAIQILDQMVRLAPRGLYLTSIKQRGLRVSVTGYAPSSDQVSEFMVNIQQSAYLEKPELVEIKGELVGVRRLSAFSLNYELKRPKATEDSVRERAGAKPSAAASAH